LFGDFAYVNFRSENIGIYPPDLFAKTKAKFISLVKRCVHPETVDGWNDPDDILERAEQADLEWRTREPEGSDTSMSAQLDEAGYGSGGVL
jgi:hypothetical protein